jgi:hypothetical protein
VHGWLFASQVYHGDFTRAIEKLMSFLAYYKSEGLNLYYVLDGQENPDKGPESFRRKNRREEANSRILAALENGESPSMSDYRTCITNTTRYIVLVAGLLDHMRLPYSVAPEEADGILAALAMDGVVISKDFDVLAHGAQKKLSVENGGGWASGDAYMTVLEEQVEENDTEPGLKQVFGKHGRDGIVYFGMATGCDFTPQASGILGMGASSVCKALMSLPYPLSPASFAAYVVSNVDSFRQMPLGFRRDVVLVGDELQNEYVDPVIKAFNRAVYYEKDCNVVRLTTGDMVTMATDETREHARGQRDPKSGLPFSEDERELLDSFKYAALGKSIVHHDKERVASHSIPDDFSTAWTVPELQAAVAARGGSVTHCKPKLIDIVQAMKDLEAEFDPIIIDCKAGLMLPYMSFKSDVY